MTLLSAHAQRLLRASPGEEPAPPLFVWLAKLMDQGDVDLFRSWLATDPKPVGTWQGHSPLSWLLALRPMGSPEGGTADQMILAYLDHQNQRIDANFNDLTRDLLSPHQGHDLLSQALAQRAMTVATWLVGPQALGRLPTEIQRAMTWPVDQEGAVLPLREGARLRGATAFKATLDQLGWPHESKPLKGASFLNHLLSPQTQHLSKVLSARFPEVWDASTHHDSLSELSHPTPLQAWALVQWRQADLGKARHPTSQREYNRKRGWMKAWLVEHGPNRPYTLTEAASLWLFSSKSTGIADSASWIPFLVDKTGLSEAEFLAQGLHAVNQVSQLKRLPESALDALAQLHHEWRTLAKPSEAGWQALQVTLSKPRPQGMTVESLPENWVTWIQQQPASLWAEGILNALPAVPAWEKVKEDLRDQGWWRQPDWYREALKGPNRERHLQTLVTYAPEVVALLRQQQTHTEVQPPASRSHLRRRS